MPLYASELLLVTLIIAIVNGEQNLIVSCQSEENVNEDLMVTVTSSRFNYPACRGETLSLTCSIHGQALIWHLNEQELFRYVMDDPCGVSRNIDRSAVVGLNPSDNIQIKSVLATSTIDNNDNGFFDCTSILDITNYNSSLIGNITCSSLENSNGNDDHPLGDRYCTYSYNILLDKPAVPEMNVHDIAKDENYTIYSLSWHSANSSENLQQYTIVSQGDNNCMAGNLSLLPISTQTWVAIENGNECNFSVVVTDKCDQTEESKYVPVNSTLLMLKEPFQEDSTVTDPTNNCIMMCRDALNSSDAINTVFDIKKLLLLGTVITIMV